MAPVGSREQKISNKSWANSFFSLMPLPGLLPDEDDRPFRYVDFHKVSSVPSVTLAQSRRIACLSEYGVQLLQQRHVFHYTRVTIDLPTIYRELAPLFTEVELEQDWVEARLRAEQSDHTALTRASAEFQEYLGPGGSERRALLKDEARRSIVRMEVRNEIRERFGSL